MIRDIVHQVLDAALHALLTGLILTWIMRRTKVQVVIKGGEGDDGGDLEPPMPRPARKAVGRTVWS